MFSNVTSSSRITRGVISAMGILSVTERGVFVPEYEALSIKGGFLCSSKSSKTEAPKIKYNNKVWTFKYKQLWKPAVDDDLSSQMEPSFTKDETIWSVVGEPIYSVSGETDMGKPIDTWIAEYYDATPGAGKQIELLTIDLSEFDIVDTVTYNNAKAAAEVIVRQHVEKMGPDAKAKVNPEIPCRRWAYRGWGGVERNPYVLKLKKHYLFNKQTDQYLIEFDERSHGSFLTTQHVYKVAPADRDGKVAVHDIVRDINVAPEKVYWKRPTFNLMPRAISYFKHYDERSRVYVLDFPATKEITIRSGKKCMGDDDWKEPLTRISGLPEHEEFTVGSLADSYKMDLSLYHKKHDAYVDLYRMLQSVYKWNENNTYTMSGGCKPTNKGYNPYRYVGR